MSVKIPPGSGRDPSLWSKTWPLLAMAAALAVIMYGCQHAMAAKKPPEEKPPPQLPWGPERRPPPPIRCSKCGGILPNCNCKPESGYYR